MCGIAGMLGLGGAPVDAGALQRMTDQVAHRGPDGQGFLFAWSDGAGYQHAMVRHCDEWPGAHTACVGLGHRRLAILDLSERGVQPMASQDGRIWIVYNGEIYNHAELRTRLDRYGYGSRSHSDTEVLLHAYQHYGTECVDHLEGMFAFAVWDSDRRCLFCARDHMGIKPFYYAVAGNRFAFASEIKSLLQLPEIEASIDDEAVLDFLVSGNCDYGERTVFRSVKALPAAHSLSVSVDDGRVDVRRYWHLRPSRSCDGTDSDRIDGLRSLLEDTIRKHLVSDVRAGSCLSGGLDSSTVVGFLGDVRKRDPSAASALGDQFYTFTSCFDNPAIDERNYALAVAESAGATPHLVFPTAADFWDDFQRLAWHQDMPFGSLGYYVQWRVMRAAQENGVKVLLDGQGGDEVFGGYAKFRYAYILTLARSRQLGAFANEVACTLGHADHYVWDIRQGYRYLPSSMRRLLGVDRLMRNVLRGDWDRLLRDDATPATRWWRNAAEVNGSNGQGTPVQRIQMDDLLVDTLPQLLRFEDRSSMAFSLEARVPFLDHRVVEYGVSLPDRLKVFRGWSKYAVRCATAGIMPEHVRWRRSKLSFEAPNRSWLAEALHPQINELISTPLRCDRYIDSGALRAWYNSSAARSANTESYLGLMRILSLEMWMRGFGL